MNKYTPINCSFYDQLLNFSSSKKHVNIVYLNDEVETEIEGVIIDVFTKNKAEFLKLDTEVVIRLDFLLKVDDILVKNSPNCSID